MARIGRPKRSQLEAKMNSMQALGLPRVEPPIRHRSANQTPRFWCPVCGMCADLDRLLTGPYEVRSAVQLYGGKREDGRGYMEYLYDDADILQQALQLLEPQILAALQLVRDELGYPIESRRRDRSFIPPSAEEEDDELFDEMDTLLDEMDTLLDEEDRLYLPEPRTKPKRRAKKPKRPAIREPESQDYLRLGAKSTPQPSRETLALPPGQPKKP
jgi:hypothetical protein